MDHGLDICREIRSARAVGHVRCGVIAGRMSLGDAAGSFGLARNSAIYRAIPRTEADAIAIHVLHIGRAHPSTIMKRDTAVDLWQRFIALFEGEDTLFATNASADLASWTPATQATFDIGVLVLGSTKVGCFWIEEED
jgi:hypothetical protein